MLSNVFLSRTEASECAAFNQDSKKFNGSSTHLNH